MRVEGRAEPVEDEEEVDAYLASRPHGSQLAAWASRQSRPMKGRAKLLAAVAKVQLRFPAVGALVGLQRCAAVLEFWVAGKFRLHDRTALQRTDDGWTMSMPLP